MPRPRQIKTTRKNEDGDIVSLQGGFGEVSKAEAIRQIERGDARYESGGSEVRVVKGATGKYLRTEPDGKTRNNLDEI